MDSLATRFAGVRGERFWARLDDSDTNACWPWPGAVDPHGYGRVVIRPHEYKAHRIAYALTYGGFDEALVVCHHCDNPPCCNPSHLFLGTMADNNRDRANKGRGRENRQWGEDNSSAKLTADDVQEIIRLVGAGHTQLEVAAQFGIVQPHVSRLVHGVSWRNL